MKNKHIGSSLDAFLKEEGALEETNAAARERVRIDRAFDLLTELPDDFLVDRADAPPQVRPRTKMSWCGWTLALHATSANS